MMPTPSKKLPYEDAPGECHLRFHLLWTELNDRLEQAGRDPLSIHDISRITKIDWKALRAWDRDEAEYLPKKAIVTLCWFFRCQPNDLMEISYDTEKVIAIDLGEKKRKSPKLTNKEAEDEELAEAAV
jgi:DNA-binding Xre family transcriptional regulator